MICTPHHCQHHSDTSTAALGERLLYGVLFEGMKRSRRQASRRPRAQKRTETKGSPLKKKRRRAEDDDLFLSQASVEVVWQCGEEVYEPISQGTPPLLTLYPRPGAHSAQVACHKTSMW